MAASHSTDADTAEIDPVIRAQDAAGRQGAERYGSSGQHFSSRDPR
jgi:hypothetical protein